MELDGTQDDVVAETSTGENRRSFLRKAAVGGAIAWTAPLILSRPALAAGSCISPQTQDWVIGAVPSGSAFVVGPNTFTLTYVDTTNAVLFSQVDTTFPRVGQPETYRMQLGPRVLGPPPLGPGLGAGPVTITLTFAPRVHNLTFSVLDVDLRTPPGGWIDQVDVTGSLLGSGVAGVGVPGPNTTTLIPNQRYVGAVNTPNGATTSDIAFTFAGFIDTVTIVYSRAGILESQGIGLSNLSWCA